MDTMISKVPEDYMSLCRTERTVRVLCTGLLLTMAVVLTATTLAAQEEPTPRAEIFAGYQWLDPGGKIPAPFGDPNNPTALKLPSLPYGVGGSFTYNFHPAFGLEADFGHNWDDIAKESTVAIGPRFTWRSEGVNLFGHTLIGLNRLAPKNLNADNAIGAVLGG